MTLRLMAHSLTDSRSDSGAFLRACLRLVNHITELRSALTVSEDRGTWHADQLATMLHIYHFCNS
jgi:hypothetical protein